MRFLVLGLLIGWVTADYTDAFARNKMYPAAAAAYMHNPAKCIENNFPGGTIKRRVNVKCDDLRIDTCCGYSAFSTSENSIILSFRGTTFGTQLIIESEETVFANHTPWAAGGAVSEYFNNGFFRIWNGGMKDDFLSLASQYPNYNLYITGHSLGGALAVLCASYISNAQMFPKNQITLLTFGEPRTGDGNFADSVDRDVPNAFRVTHYKDPVPHLPLKNMEGYRHHKNEAYYLEDMGPGANFTLCNADESVQCSDSNKFDNVFNDHVTYFNIVIGDYAEKGCKFPS